MKNKALDAPIKFKKIEMVMIKLEIGQKNDNFGSYMCLPPLSIIIG